MGASFRPRDDEHSDDGVVAEINITPLTDVFLVLLIIFMVTTSVIQNQGKNIDLPGAKVSDATPQGVTVTVSPEGGILVNDEPTPYDKPSFWRMRSASRELRNPPPVMKFPSTSAGYSGASSRIGMRRPAWNTALSLSGASTRSPMAGRSLYVFTRRANGF